MEKPHRITIAAEEWKTVDRDFRVVAIQLELVAARMGVVLGRKMEDRGMRLARDLTEYRRAVRRQVAAHLNVSEEEGD